MEQIKNIGSRDETPGVCTRRMKDPLVHKHSDGKWYFVNETFSECHGPYESETQASESLKQYAREL